MGNSQKGLLFEQNFKQIKKQSHKILGMLRYLSNKNNHNLSIVKEYRFSTSVQYQNLLNKFKRRKLLTNGKNTRANKCLIKVQDFKSQEVNEMCGITYHVYAFLESFQSDLSTIFHQKRGKSQFFSEEQLSSILTGVMHGLIMIYDNNMRSFLISKDSILIQNGSIENDSEIRIIDLDLASAYHPYYQILNLSSIKKGHYLSPELLEDLSERVKQPYFNPKSDVFSLGMVILELALMEELDYLYNYQCCHINFELIYQKLEMASLSREFKDILTQMLAENQEERIGLVSLRQKICPNYKAETLRNIRTRTNSQLSSRKFNQTVKSQRMPSYDKGIRRSFNANTNDNHYYVPTKQIKVLCPRGYHNQKSIQMPKISIMKTIETNNQNSTIFFDQKQVFDNFNRSKRENTTDLTSSIQKTSRSSNKKQNQPPVKSINITLSNKGLAQQKFRNSIGFKSTKFIKSPLDNQSLKKSHIFNVDYDQMQSDIKNRINCILEQTQNIRRQQSSKIIERKVFINDQQCKSRLKVNESLSLQTPSQKMNMKSFNFNIDNSTPIRKIQALKFTEQDSSQQKQNVINSFDFKLNNPLKVQPVQKYSLRLSDSYQEKAKSEYKIINLSSGQRYEGEVNQVNQFDGTGVLYYPNKKIKYSGSWKRNMYQGLGVLYNLDPSQVSPYFELNCNNFEENPQNIWVTYEGGFLNGFKNGFGQIHFSNGQKFSGTFRNDKIDGYGTFYKKDGNIINAMWDKNKRKFQTSNRHMYKKGPQHILYV